MASSPTPSLNIMAEETPSIRTFNQLAEFFQQCDDSQVQNVIESITYNVQSQTFVIKVRDLLRREEEKIEAPRLQAAAPVKTSAEKAIQRLSSSFIEKFPKLLQYWREWLPSRNDLINECENCADKLDSNTVLASMCRILTSTADLVGTWRRYMGSQSTWVLFALENAPAVSFVSLFIQRTLCKRMHNRITTLVEIDQEKFEPIKQWFQQSKELDAAVRNFFPYGIDQELVLKINQTATNSDEYSKIFMSVIASNAQKDIKLFKDMEFLDKADKFSTSEVGVKWYRKVLMENDPVYTECFKQDLEDEIKMSMRKMLEASPTERPEVLIDTTLLLSSRVKTKILLNGLSIFSASSTILDGGQSEESRVLRKLSEKCKKELKALKNILVLLKPDGTEIDQNLL